MRLVKFLQLKTLLESSLRSEQVFLPRASPSTNIIQCDICKITSYWCPYTLNIFVCFSHQVILIDKVTYTQEKNSCVFMICSCNLHIGAFSCPAFQKISDVKIYSCKDSMCTATLHGRHTHTQQTWKMYSFPTHMEIYPTYNEFLDIQIHQWWFIISILSNDLSGKY